jgi:hypothetical protein
MKIPLAGKRGIPAGHARSLVEARARPTVTVASRGVSRMSNRSSPGDAPCLPD